jgi:hypothetical protein
MFSRMALARAGCVKPAGPLGLTDRNEIHRQKEREVFFFEKKQQKTFLNACGAPHAQGPETARA